MSPIISAHKSTVDESVRRIAGAVDLASQSLFNAVRYCYLVAENDFYNINAKDIFRIGLNKDFTLVPHALYFQTGLDYIYLNAAKDKSIASLKIIGDRTEHALSIPLRLKYLVPVSDKIKVGVDAGPSLVCGLSSKLKYRTRLNENSTAFYIYDYHSGKTKVESMPPAVQEWADAQQPWTSLRRLDVQLGAAVAAEFLDVLEAKVGCDFGLINNYKGQLSDAYKMRQGQFYLAVGLRF